MRIVIFALILLMTASQTHAEEPLAPIVLSPEDYRQIMSVLMQRDPIMSVLINKQQQARKDQEAKRNQDAQQKDR